MLTKVTILFPYAILFILVSLPGEEPVPYSNSIECSCDPGKVSQIILDNNFNRIPKYDTPDFPADSLYGLSPQENRRLWYRDIESPKETKLTKYWNDYASANYHADHIDFIHYYENKPAIELAFQFGPNMDLWAYHIFVIRKIDCCYLATRSYFRHARFTYKAYSIIDQNQVDQLFQVLEVINKIPVDTTRRLWNYRGYFADNRNKRTYYIDLANEVEGSDRTPKSEVKSLYDFVDSRIEWKVTYD